MLRQSLVRLIHSRSSLLCLQLSVGTAKRRALSTAQNTGKGLDLTWQLLAGGAIAGGSTYIAHHYGYLGGSKSGGHHDDDGHHHQKGDASKSASTVEPVLVKGLPESVPFLIVGGGTAAFAASRAIRSNDPKARVLLISAENHYPYMRPPLSKELWYSGSEVKKEFTFKQWNGREKSIFFEHEEFYLPLEQFESAPNGGITVVKGQRVVKIDATDRKAFLENGQIISYGKCLIATGGEPKNLQVFENVAPEIENRVILYRNVDDFKRLNELFSKSKSITIIGGGLLGSELACALADKSRRAKAKVQLNQLMPEQGVLERILPQYLSNWCSKKVMEEGVNLIPSATVKDVQLNNNQLALSLTNGETLKTDYAIVAVGLNPNVELAETSSLEVDDTLGGYRVNAELEVRSNLWVAGDAACFYDQKLGRRRVEHHDHAVVSGRLAGENMTGAGKPYWHQSMFWSDLGTEVGFEAIGVIDSSLPTFGVFAKNGAEASEGFREPQEDDKYKKGVIFYQRNNTVVGIVLWNLYNNMHIARRVLNDGVQNQDLNEVAKLFALYPSEVEEDEHGTAGAVGAVAEQTTDAAAAAEQ